MRVVFVAPYLPTPGSGGRTRLINLMERMSRSHELSLVAFSAADQDPADVPYPCAAVPYPERRRPPGLQGSFEFYRERVFGRLPVFATQTSSATLADALREQIARTGPDIVQIEHPEMGQYFKVVRGGPLRVLDFHDVASRWIESTLARTKGTYRRAVMTVELAKSRRYESKLARAVELCFVCSSVERDELRRISGIEAIVNPNGVDTQAFVPMPDVAEEPGRLLFVGPMHSPANRDAVDWFARRILPLVLREQPDAWLDVAGTTTGETFGNGVHLLGKVPDVRPHLAAAPVGVVPIRVAAGTRYKILEGLSMERAIVSTTAGAEGLGLVHREHLLIADDAETFAKATVELMRSPQLRRRLGEAGRRFVAERYDWEPIAAQMEGCWEAAMRTRRSRENA